WPAGKPQRGQSHRSGIAASLAKLGTVSCLLAHQKEIRTRGAASPRSASPIGPAPTRLPRMALPLLTAHPLPQDAPAARSGGRLPYYQRFVSSPSATMHTNHSTPQKTVILSRFRSTTDDEPSEDEIPPPKRSDSPPPFPLCSSTRTTMSKLVMIKTIEIAMNTAVSRLSWGCRSGNRGQLTIPADPDEISGIQAGPAYQRPVDVWLGHDRGHVVGLH